VVVAQRVGRLLGRNSRAAGAFEVKIEQGATEPRPLSPAVDSLPAELRQAVAHPSVLLGLWVVEDAGPTVPARRVGQRTAEGIRGACGDHPGRRSPAGTNRRDDPEALHQSSHRAPGDPAPAPWFAPPNFAGNGPWASRPQRKA